MRKLKLEMQVSLDGFTADPDGRTDWMVWNWSADWTWDAALRQHHIDLTTSSDCILLSRAMAVEGFSRHWEKVAADPSDPQHAFAKPVADMRKVVFTKTLEGSAWRHTELAKGDLAETVNRLKREPGKDLLAYGGPTFASSLIRADLIDEFHLFVNPTILGHGRSMFRNLGRRRDLRLVKSTAYPCGVTVLLYDRPRG
ncbi:MAG TPA: dihydrofolate reductase family protein [Geothrix sp.]|nr:dihydrofolate reductase family protein [Geothrix sp.]